MPIPSTPVPAILFGRKHPSLAAPVHARPRPADHCLASLIDQEENPSLATRLRTKPTIAMPIQSMPVQASPILAGPLCSRENSQASPCLARPSRARPILAMPRQTLPCLFVRKKTQALPVHANPGPSKPLPSLPSPSSLCGRKTPKPCLAGPVRAVPSRSLPRLATPATTPPGHSDRAASRGSPLDLLELGHDVPPISRRPVAHAHLPPCGLDPAPQLPRVHQIRRVQHLKTQRPLGELRPSPHDRRTA